MSQSIRALAIDITDPDGVGPLQCQVTAQVTNSDANSAAVGFTQTNDVRQCVLGRPAFNALLAALKRPNTDTWPDGVLAHPVAKAP